MEQSLEILDHRGVKTTCHQRAEDAVHFTAGVIGRCDKFRSEALFGYRLPFNGTKPAAVGSEAHQERLNLPAFVGVIAQHQDAHNGDPGDYNPDRQSRPNDEATTPRTYHS
jgi:hypothetical protein